MYVCVAVSRLIDSADNCYQTDCNMCSPFTQTQPLTHSHFLSPSDG